VTLANKEAAQESAKQASADTQEGDAAHPDPILAPYPYPYPYPCRR